MVCVTKYGRRVFTDEYPTTTEPARTGGCADFDAAPVEYTDEDDHQHLLVEYPPTVQLSRLVTSLKGVSSRRRMRFRLHTHHDHLWSPSYLAAPCGGALQQRRPT